jgi:alanyl-tRNA synthetase
VQQHTGQHILSQAFVHPLQRSDQKFSGSTITPGEIDVDLNNPSDEIIERAVELANNVIWEDRQITIRTLLPKKHASLTLRKDPAREGELRLIQI